MTFMTTNKVKAPKSPYFIRETKLFLTELSLHIRGCAAYAYFLYVTFGEQGVLVFLRYF